MNTQQILDYLAANGILTSVVYGDAQNELTPDTENQGRYFSVDICLTAKRLVLGKPKMATSFIEAVQIAYEEAISLGWITESLQHSPERRGEVLEVRTYQIGDIITQNGRKFIIQDIIHDAGSDETLIIFKKWSVIQND